MLAKQAEINYASILASMTKGGSSVPFEKCASHVCEFITYYNFGVSFALCVSLKKASFF